ncbi:MAG: zinc transporter ZupT [Thermoproteota archaeon]
METSIILNAFLFSFFAGISTGIGSLLSFFIKDLKHGYLSSFMGFSAGVMIQISFVELLFTAIMDAGFLYANISFFLGALTIALMDFLIPHEYKGESPSEGKRKYKRLMRTGLLVSLGIAIHNLPEGLITLFGTIKDPHLGLALMVAVALHNIPEGISVSIPIYYATGSRKKAFTWSLLSGLSEPMGALIGFTILYPFINPFVLNMALAFVAGIMVFISFDELLPTSLEYGEGHTTITTLFLGMTIMTLIIFLLE